MPLVRHPLTRKLLLAGTAVLVGAALVATFIISNVLLIRSAMDQVIAQTMEQVKLTGHFNTSVFQSIFEAETFARTHDPADRDQTLQALQSAQALLAQLNNSTPTRTALIPDADSAKIDLQQQRIAVFTTAELDVLQILYAVDHEDTSALAHTLADLSTIEGSVEALEVRSSFLANQSMHAATATMNTVIQRAIISIAGLLSLLGLAVLGLLQVMRQTIVRPLAQLSAVAERVAAGNLDQTIAVTSDDEIGRLQSTFQHMLSSLQTAWATIVEYQATLEARVRERTTALAISNTQLQHELAERHQVDAALRETEERFRTLVEQLPAITYIAALDAASSTIYTSPQIETMLGFTQAEWMADHDLWRKQLHPVDYERVMADVEVSQRTGMPVPSEYRLIRRDGQARWFRDQAVLVKSADGVPRFIQGIMFDITEYKQAEEALRVSEARNRALLNAIPDQLFQIERDGTYHPYNADDRPMRDSRSAALHQPIAEVLDPALAQQTMRAVTEALRTGRVQAFEYQSRVSGMPHDAEARVVVSGVDETLMIVRDITERKQIERMKNEFIATVSHELRTPLTSIRGALGLLTGGVAGALPIEAQAMLQIAYKNSERLIRLINDILDSEKIEMGQLAFDLQPVAVQPLIAQAIEANRAYGDQFQVTFALESWVEGALVQADSERLLQVFANLLSNAAKFSPPGGIVGISLVRSNRTIRIAVRDQGLGIPATFRGRIFQKFAQADSSDTRQKGGTGLGLSISKAIVERLGGQIGFETGSKGGTTFYVDLPEWQTSAV